jgi:hypothetical protein
MLRQIQEIYLFTHKIIKKIVMSFTANHIEGSVPNKKQTTPLSSNQLSVKELEVLLSIIKRTTFLGEDIEPMYNMVIKLQNQYLEQK